ncbi:MAG: hypothetical protein IKZ54_01100 [Bacteroidales bacterium]|nr:hypothetical protein [Bacteroidales bacterium]
MDGKYLNQVNSIDRWATLIVNNKVSWEANNLHIDEIDGLRGIPREQWLQSSLSFLIMTYRNYLISNYLIFLHIPLNPSNGTPLQTITKSWIERNISEFTPPSFNFTSKEYFKEFYRNELLRITSPSIDDFDNSEELLFFYRIFHDEDLYYNEIYVFPRLILMQHFPGIQN